jgi:hypothetical protein
VEPGGDVGVPGGWVVLDREQVIPAGVEHGLGWKADGTRGGRRVANLRTRKRVELMGESS